MAAPLHKHKRTTLERVEKFVSTSEWTDCNLSSVLRWQSKQVVVQLEQLISSCKDPAEQRISWAEASAGSYEKIAVGRSYGPTWSTHWFKVKYQLPDEYVGKEINLIWNFDAEALVWSENGDPLQGLSGEYNRTSFCIAKNLSMEERFGMFYVEMACNGVFGAGKNGLISPPDPNKSFTLKSVEIAVFNRQVYHLMMDLKCLAEMAKHLPESNPRSFQALYTANQMLNTIVIGDSHSYEVATKLADGFFSQFNGASQHSVVAVGNCHIDSAWLWPYAETIRKCARSWSSSIRLMEDYPNFKFVCSQAQQLAWVKQHYPTLWNKILTFHKQGQFIPVGGTWVEMDGNIPSGESFIRQFLYGQKFFKENFGKNCTEFWLPDTFGYSAQLPQIMKHCGISRFLTQKLSWSLVNSFPHHNFWWEGIDGSAVLSHFPPGDSYSMQVTVEELLKTVSNLKDKGRASKSMFLYGHGDGGGGPTEDMLQRLHRFADVDGLPKAEQLTPDKFFTQLESESSNLCRWVGELYLELHNGTYTTHADVKKLNREGEVKLRDAELLASVLFSYTRNSEEYEKDQLSSIWHKLLLNQFHDVLPGTSINLVYKDVLLYYQEIMKFAKLWKDDVSSKLFGSCELERSFPLLVNSLSWTRQEIITTNSGKTILVSVPSMSASKIQPLDVQPVTVASTDGCLFLENRTLRAKLDAAGRLLSVVLKENGRESIKPGLYGNQLAIYDDVPLFWDAWDVMDYHLETRKEIVQISVPLHVLSEMPERVVLQTVLSVGTKSTYTLNISMDACKPYVLFEVQLDWQESHKFLKVEFPVNVVAKQATYEIQFGHIARPTHQNTSWEAAQFEVCGHKWADISEYNFGAAVLNDCKYGYSTRSNVLSLSLVRAPKSPDEHADIGVHHFQYAFMPYHGTFQDAGVIQRAYELNHPLLKFHGDQSQYFAMEPSLSWFQLGDASVMISSVKKAEHVQALVLRMYECFGGHSKAKLTTALKILTYQFCNGLEDGEGPVRAWPSEGIVIPFSPFKIVSLLMFA